jgi:hypothetical protein
MIVSLHNIITLFIRPKFDLEYVCALFFETEVVLYSGSNLSSNMHSGSNLSSNMHANYAKTSDVENN